MRALKPGEEFLFNYNITQENEWLDGASDEGSVKDSGFNDYLIGTSAREINL